MRETALAMQEIVKSVNDVSLRFRQKHSSPQEGEVERRLRLCDPGEILTISCIDYREDSKRGFLLTSAGNIPHENMIEDLHLILPRIKMLILRCHTDCAKTRSQVLRQASESDFSYKRRVEGYTIARLWKDAERLLRDPQIKEALSNGLMFCAARFDVSTRKTSFFEAQSKALIAAVLKAQVASPALEAHAQGICGCF